jgi:hypothetical protein
MTRKHNFEEIQAYIAKYFRVRLRVRGKAFKGIKI